MPGHELSNPRKRRFSDPPSQNHSLQRVSKRTKRSDQSKFKDPSAFWDSLSTTYLTRSALLELNRREALSSRPCCSLSGRRLTRSTLAQLRATPSSLVSAIDYLDNCDSRTLRSIKRTARQGGLDLLDIRGFQRPPHPLGPRMSSSRSSSRVPKRSSSSAPNTKSSSRTTTTKSTGPYDRNFQQKLIDGGVYPAGYRHPNGQAAMKPENWEEIQARLRQSRPSLSPSRFSEEDYEKFVQADADAAKERQVTTSVIPIIEGNITDAKCVSGGIPFTNLEPLTDGTLVSGNPDIYYGHRPEQLGRPVRDELSAQVVPSTQDSLPIAPNFFVAAKGPDGSLAVAGRQASYDGALGARGIHSLQSYRQEDPSFDNKAYTITSIYHGGQLKMYTSHLTRPSGVGSRPEYFTTPLRSFAMADTAETFRQGATCYRNAREWAEEQRDEAIRLANQRASERGAQIAVTVLSPVPTSPSGLTVEKDSSASHESQTEGDEASSVIADPRDCRTPPPEPGLGSQPAKRSGEQVKQQSPLQRKRHNRGDDANEPIQQPELQVSGASGLSQQFGDQVLGQESDSESSETRQ